MRGKLSLLGQSSSSAAVPLRQGSSPGRGNVSTPAIGAKVLRRRGPWRVYPEPLPAAEIALAVAEAVDRKLATLPDDLVERNAATGSPLNFARADHRRQHLDEIVRTIPARER